MNTKELTYEKVPSPLEEWIHNIDEKIIESLNHSPSENEKELPILSY